MLRTGLLACALALCETAYAQLPPAAKVKIEFTRDKFSVSEAMTYYQFVLDEILDREKRGAG